MAANLHSNDGDLGFQVAPMVDVVFVLMLFFLASAAFQDREFDLDAALSVPPIRARPGLPLTFPLRATGQSISWTN